MLEIALPDDEPARCEHCGQTIELNRQAANEPTAGSPAEKLFYPPGFGRQSKSQPTIVEPSKPAVAADGLPSSDRYPPGFRGPTTERRARSPALVPIATFADSKTPLAEGLLPPGISLPPGTDALPPEEPPFARVDDLLPQTSFPEAIPSNDAIRDARFESSKLPSVANNQPRGAAEEKQRRRFIGNLIVWSICAILMFLTLWLLLRR